MDPHAPQPPHWAGRVQPAQAVARAAAVSRLTLTTNPGLEDVVTAEIGERAADVGLDRAALAFPDSGVGGRVRVDLPLTAAGVRTLALSLRSIHHVLRHVMTFPLPTAGALDEVYRRLYALDWPELDSTTPFRVTSARHGQHDFTSQQLQAAAGAALQARTGAPVDLQGYAVNVQVDAVGELCTVGVRWTERPLGLRFERPFNRRVALKPPVAYALLRLAAGDRSPRRLLDPFCGTGTILLEAGELLPALELVGSDVSRACVDGAARNLERAGRAQRARLLHGDARQLALQHPPESFDLIATNPPYGRKLGRGIRFARFYGDLLAAARAVAVPGARLGLLVGKRGAFRVALQRTGGWRLRHVRIVDMNRVHAGLFVLERE